MSSYEYIDLCEKAQNESSKYHIFTFDMVNSRSPSKGLEEHIKMEELMYILKKKIE